MRKMVVTFGGWLAESVPFKGINIIVSKLGENSYAGYIDEYAGMCADAKTEYDLKHNLFMYYVTVKTNMPDELEGYRYL